jgi:purine-binding chemotaxis protein CheW
MADTVSQPIEEEDTLKGRFLTFALGSESYGIEIKFVTEIIGIQPITEVPELPNYIKGIVNLRGKIIPLMDVRLRFNKEAQAYDDRTCIIVTEIERFTIGLIVDRVSEVISIPDSEILPLPRINKDKSKYIKNIGKVGGDVKLILDCLELLSEEEANLVNLQ